MLNAENLTDVNRASFRTPANYAPRTTVRGVTADSVTSATTVTAIQKKLQQLRPQTRILANPWHMLIHGVLWSFFWTSTITQQSLFPRCCMAMFPRRVISHGRWVCHVRRFIAKLLTVAICTLSFVNYLSQGFIVAEES